MNYAVGDTVVHPHHGAAVIENCEQRTLDGQERDYLVLRFTYGNLTLEVPPEACDEVGLRDVCSPQQVDAVWEVLRDRDYTMPTNWSRRFKANHEKLRSGEILEVAAVVRNLALRERDKGLSAGEKRMLTQARQLLVSELSAAIKESGEHTEELIDKVLTD